MASSAFTVIGIVLFPHISGALVFFVNVLDDVVPELVVYLAGFYLVGTFSGGVRLTKNLSAGPSQRDGRRNTL